MPKVTTRSGVFLRGSCLAVVFAVCVVAGVCVAGDSTVTPLSTAEARATRGSQTCGKANLVNVWLCDGEITAHCLHDWHLLCYGNCRDGCTRALSPAPAEFGPLSWGFTEPKSCGTPGLGMTYNVRNCRAAFFNCCTGAITGTFACNSATVIAWTQCGPIWGETGP